MSSVISNGYISCEYIESSGTQYIDTGFTPTSKTKVIYDFAYTSLVPQYSGIYIDGSRLMFGLNSRLEIYLGSTTNTSLTATTNRQTIVFDIPNKTALVNGTTVLQNISYTPKAYTLPIFAMRNGSGISNYSYFKLYSCQIYDDNVLIMDFKPCRNTNGVYGLFDEVNNVFYTTPTGTFTGNAIYSGIQFNRSFRRRMLTFKSSKVDYSSKYFTIEAIENGTLSFSKHGAGDDIQYSKDNGNTWNMLASGETIRVNAGDKVLWKSNITPSTIWSDGYGIGKFSSSNKFNVCGNIMSLLYGNDFIGETSLNNKNYSFSYLFEQCEKLIDASNLILPATTLAINCYDSMFRSCKSLTTAPELPATTLVDDCYSAMFAYCESLKTAPELPAAKIPERSYSSMFAGCTSLVNAPELPITSLDTYSCSGMFYGCTSLITAPELPATDLGTACYNMMFCGCTSLTTAPSRLYSYSFPERCFQSMFQNCTSLTTPPELPATSVWRSCYESMFEGCTSLTTAPELPATSVGNEGYYRMFRNCTSLTTVQNRLPITKVSTSCCQEMFAGCTSLTTAPALPATTLAAQCYKSMFEGCINLAPSYIGLDATTLVEQCYQRMFYGCSSLNFIRMVATDISANQCLESWVYGVSPTGRFIKNSSMTSLPIGGSGIPSGWTVTNSDGSPVTGGGSSSGGSTTANISWVVQTGSWTEGSNPSTEDGKQFTSVSPGSNGSTRLRCTFSGVTSITFTCIYNGESNYDYLTVGNLDSTCTRNSYGTTLKGTSGTTKDITFSCDSGTHYVEFCYSKDGSVDTPPDCAVVYIKNCS